MDHAEDSKLRNPPVADDAWGEALELEGTEDWLTTEPELYLDGDPGAKS